MTLASEDFEVRFAATSGSESRPYYGKRYASGGNEILYLDNPQENPRLNGRAMSVPDLIAALAAKDGMPPRLAAARKRLAAELKAADKPITLSELRLSRGLSQAELAAKIGTSQSMLSRIEGGSQEPGARTIRALSVALEVDFNELMAAI